ncbi:MAG TPA: BlaI/MecI/CopY family transcriptional regulator [Gemmatimonadaceae bacterium]|nr:BlaI/MecI/CopY family transcriptional regulator [Gemmatimonadaceae bacterium]
MTESRTKPSPPGAKLTRRERQIMDILYRDGEGTVGDVMAQMPDPPSYSAVRATMNVLEEKGHIRHRQDGPRYVYLPAVPRERARNAALNHLLQTFFDGSAESAVVALLQMTDSQLSTTDFERLADQVRKARQEGR